MIINNQLFFDIGSFSRNKLNKVWVVGSQEDLQSFSRISMFYYDLDNFSKIGLPQFLTPEIYQAYARYEGDLSVYIDQNAEFYHRLDKQNFVDDEEKKYTETEYCKPASVLSSDDIITQFYESSSLSYFHGNQRLIGILKKLLIKISSVFRNFTKNRMEIRKIGSTLKNICEVHLQGEMKDPETAKDMQDPDVFMMHFNKELFDSKIFTSALYSRPLPDIGYSKKYFEKIGYVNVNLQLEN